MSKLGAFSEALVAPGEPQSDVLPDAIPDIWGKALTFAHSLSDEKHIFHGRSVASFRGFLAMLAFRHIYRYNLTAVRVEFYPDSVHMFESVLARRSEAEGLVEPDGESARWNPAYVFLLDEQAIGMCSPLTLITPQEGFQNINSRLSWLTDGFRFTDPTERLGFRQSAVLSGWLERLQGHVATSARRGIWRNVLLHQLSNFQEVLSRKSGRASSPVVYALGDFGLKAELFEPLGKALAPSEDEGKSHFELLATRRRSDRTLVVDEEIIRHLPAGSEIIGEITAAVLKDQPLGLDKTFLGQYPLPPGWRWIRPAEFLLPQLTMIELQDSFVNVAAIPVYQGHASDGSLLPPLDERVTEYLDADVIAKNCWFERTAEGFTFGLRLPVAGDERIEAKKCYNFADIRKVSCYELPVVEIWPSSKMAHWNCYYTFWGTDGFENDLYMCPSGTEFAPDGKLTGPKRQQVTLTREFPQYLTCFLLSNGGVRRGTQLGLLMPTIRDQPPTGLPRTLNIGFDFGSTNTHIMFAGEHGASPEPLIIHPSSLQILRVQSFRRESLMYQFFIPSNGESTPFASLMRRRVPFTIGFEALRDAHVLFPHPDIAEKQFDDLNLGSDLKWGGPN